MSNSQATSKKLTISASFIYILIFQCFAYPFIFPNYLIAHHSNDEENEWQIIKNIEEGWNYDSQDTPLPPVPPLPIGMGVRVRHLRKW